MIGRLFSQLHKLKGRSPHELYSRISQRAYTWGERAALRFGRQSTPLPRVDPLTFARPFFSGITNADSTAAALRNIAPHDELEVLDRAARIERGDVPLLGYGFVHIGTSPNWQHDPFADLTAPLRHWSTIPYLDPSVVGDHKTVWEISRHQYFVTLGQAWRYTREDRWPQAFRNYLQSWLDNNPPSVGMNWASSLEVSYRAISWIWALQLMHDAPSIDDALKAKTLKSLQFHGRHLERFLSTYFSPNTHLTGEALGLVYIGTQCPELPQAKRWRELGARILESSLEHQVHADGVYFEQATQYHRYTIDIYLHYLLLAKAARFTVSLSVESALNRLFDVLLFLTRGDGTIPLLGDDDGGRLVQLDDRKPHEVRALLATGAVVLGRSDLAWMGRGDDASLGWMLGDKSIAARDALVTSPPVDCACAFPDGGLYVMRDGWTANSAHAVIDAGPHGALSFGHSHADPLSVVLTVGGHPVFVDSGTYTYVGADRDAFRSTAAHNTVEIDGMSTSTPGTAFRWQSVSHAVATSWTSEQQFTCFSGTHSGYLGLRVPLGHERTILQAMPGLWIVRDALKSEGQHDAALRWHCSPGIHAATVASVPGLSVLDLHEGNVSRALLVTLGGQSGASSMERGWVSEQFGHKTASDVCVWRERTNGNAVLTSIVIDPEHYRLSVEATAQLRSESGGALGAVAFSARRGSDTEQVAVLVGDGQAITFRDLRISADMACVTLDLATGDTRALVLVGATSANENGVTFVRPSERKQWAIASRNDAGSWHIRSGEMTAPGAGAMNDQRSFDSTPSTV